MLLNIENKVSSALKAAVSKGKIKKMIGKQKGGLGVGGKVVLK
jgi:hypothetical protein